MGDDLHFIKLKGRGWLFNLCLEVPPEPEGLVVLHHGAGSSAYTFAAMIAELRKLQPHIALLAFDMRGHGDTDWIGPGDDTKDFTLQTLAEDLAYVVNSAVSMRPNLEQKPILLVGHSLGGTVVSHAAFSQTIGHVSGLVVIEAVEGYATQSMRSMHSLLSTWPQEFSSPEAAVEWHLGRGHQLHNRYSAQLSVPHTLRYSEESKTWKRRPDLQETADYWDTWFKHLDKWFLEAPVARMLILAGAGRLDKDLTVGQMMGKYQLVLYNDCGHYLHEDQYERTAQCLSQFWDRVGTPVKIMPKFGKFRSP